MNRQQVEGKWQQLKGSIQEKWGKLTHDELDMIQGRREVIDGKLRELRGISQERADRQKKVVEKAGGEREES